MVWLTIQLVSLFCIQNVFSATVESCDSPIYCQGELLDTVQYKVKVFNDSKTFVDLSQINSPNVTLANFKSLMTKTDNKPTLRDMREFLDNNFKSQGELDEWTPPDYNKNPSFLNKISSYTIRNFAKNLVSIWPKLGRKINDIVLKYPDRHSLIPLPNGFIVPGGRFQEIYYWDSYWIIKGLLISEMKDTSRGMLENLLSLVKRLGFVPNGNRVYYKNRSQPPLLTRMVGLYVDATYDLTWLRSIIGTLEQELTWWEENRFVTFQKNGKNYTLARYLTASNTPRPESYYEDIETCKRYTEQTEKEECYRNLKSGAESGWDYSSRWIPNNSKENTLAFIKMSQIIPVDLNAFLCGAHKELSRFHDLLGNTKEALMWYEKAIAMQNAIDAVLYDWDDGIWYDYDIVSQTSKKMFYPSNFSPLWANAYNTNFKKGYGARAAKYFTKKINESEIIGGLPASLVNTGEQWDYPSCWPPLQDIVLTGLYSTGHPEAEKIALKYVKIWVEANEIGFSSSGEMYEKYDAEVPGQFGGGGEYNVQTGFGWSNGVAISFIDQFPGLFSQGSPRLKPFLSVMLSLAFSTIFGHTFKIF